MKKETREPKTTTKMPISYHIEQHAWSMKDAVGMSAYLMKTGKKMDILVNEGQPVEINTPLAICGEETLLAPFRGTVKEINPVLKERSVNGGDWIVRIA